MNRNAIFDEPSYSPARATNSSGAAEPCTERTPSFTVVFYGGRIFCCKTAQFCVTRCECEMTEIPNIGNDAQADENPRENSLLNYKSVALSKLSYGPRTRGQYLAVGDANFNFDEILTTQHLTRLPN